MFSADIHPTSALSLTDARKMRVWRIVRFAALTLVSWSLLAWGAAAALITRAELPRADAIVVLSNARAYTERTYHAAQLWKEGRAPRVLLTNENLRSSWSEGQQRNPFFYERATEELKRVGVRPEKIEVLPDAVGSTYEEAVLLRKFAAQHNLHSILIVTSAYHSRRALWTFRQVFAGTGVDVGLDAPAPGQQTPHPATWWLRPSGWTTVALEYPKLIYYWARYRAYVDATSSYDSASSSTVQAKTTVGESRAGLTLSLTAPTIAYVNEVILIDARNSAGVSRKPQANGTTSVRIDFGDGFTCDLLACGHAYRAAGIYTIILSAKNDKGIAAIPVSASINVIDIPSATGLNKNNGAGQNLIDMTNSAGNSVYYIAPNTYSSASNNAAKLQNAIKYAAQRNSVEQEIVLPAGAVFAGPIVLAKPFGPNSGNKYITIRSANITELPSSGNRISPADAQNMPTITAPSSTNATLAALWTPNPAAANPSHHYRLIGLSFKKQDGNQSQVLVSIGDHNVGQNAYSMQPTYFIVDRCYFDGGTGTSNLGLRIAGDYVTVIDSYFKDFKVPDVGGIDAVAIGISKGKGFWAIWNNYLEASTENFFVGGGEIPLESWTATISSATTTSATLSSVTGLEIDQNIALPVGGAYSADRTTIVRSISGNNISFDAISTVPDNAGTAKWAITPSFLEFRRNYCYKPTKWRSGQPNYDGSNWQIKNLWEAKVLRYGVIDGNVFRNSWVAAQKHGLVLTPRNHNGFSHETAVIRELQFSNNIFRDMGNWLATMASDDIAGQPTQLLSDVTFRNNLIWNVGENYQPAAGGPDRYFFALIKGLTTTKAKRIYMIHNTFDGGTPSVGTHITYFGSTNDGSGASESIWTNNVAQHGYGFTSEVAGGSNSAANITSFLPPGNATVWNRNMIANKGGAIYPASGVYVSGSWTKQFVDYANGDFTLVAGSGGKGAATDATDIGVNTAALKAATAGAVSGTWSAPTSTRPRKVSQ